MRCVLAALLLFGLPVVAGAQLVKFGAQAVDFGVQRLHGSGDLGFGEARGNVLRAIPIPCFYFYNHCSFNSCSISRIFQFSD